MRIDEIEEAVNFGSFPDSDFDANKFISSQAHDAVKVEDVSKNLSLWQSKDILMLMKDQTTLLGFVRTEPKMILNNTYSNVGLIYIQPEYRNTSAAKWLLYAVKEYVKNPIIADGAIFQGGQDLIRSMMRLGASRISSLNKETGEKQKITEPINDPDLCYIFESTRLGFGKNYFNEDVTYRGNGWIWYPLFEEI